MKRLYLWWLQHRINTLREQAERDAGYGFYSIEQGAQKRDEADRLERKAMEIAMQLDAQALGVE